MPGDDQVHRNGDVRVEVGGVVGPERVQDRPVVLAFEPVADPSVDQLQVAGDGLQGAAGPVGHHRADPTHDVGRVSPAEVGRGQLRPNRRRTRRTACRGGSIRRRPRPPRPTGGRHELLGARRCRPRTARLRSGALVPTRAPRGVREVVGRRLRCCSRRAGRSDRPWPLRSTHGHRMTAALSCSATRAPEQRVGGQAVDQDEGPSVAREQAHRQGGAVRGR